MNSTASNQSKGFKGILILLVMGILVSNYAMAQRFSGSSKKLFVGMEGMYGTRSLHLTSDIETIDNLTISSEGGGFGVVAGTRAFRVRVQESFYSSKSFVEQTVKLIESSGAINIYPLQLSRKKGKGNLAPYVIAGIQMSNVKLYGSYVAEPVIVPLKEEEDKCHHNSDGGGPLADPDLPSSSQGGTAPPTDPTSSPTAPSDPGASNPDDVEPEKSTPEYHYIGKISTLRATVGLGLELRVPARKHFVHIYTELKYGQPLTSKNTNVALQGTRVSGLLAVDVGVSFGLSK